jgi:TATA-box binding protein (TBP) (component of TFIID and TFIIIB)
MELVNAVGGGDVKRELDLAALHGELATHEQRYQPEYHPALKLKFTPDSPTVLLFGSGKYNIAGASSEQELWSTHKELIQRINRLITIDEDDVDFEFEVRNLVYLDEFDKELDLYQLSESFDNQETRYEPEVMSCLYYSPNPDSGTFMIFSTGKILHTGLSDSDTIKKLFSDLFNQIDSLFQE